jgi:hypothetical protein
MKEYQYYTILCMLWALMIANVYSAVLQIICLLFTGIFSVAAVYDYWKKE